MASETRDIHDPFIGKTVQINDRLTDRLRGRYACGPQTEGREPEFGWREFETVPIQHEAATEIERLNEVIAKTRAATLEEAAKECDRHAEFCKTEAHKGGDWKHLMLRFDEATYNAKRIRAL